MSVERPVDEKRVRGTLDMSSTVCHLNLIITFRRFQTVRHRQKSVRDLVVVYRRRNRPFRTQNPTAMLWVLDDKVRGGCHPCLDAWSIDLPTFCQARAIGKDPWEHGLGPCYSHPYQPTL